MTISQILDQPQSIDYADLSPGAFNRLANHELVCWLDAACNPHSIHWPWGDHVYARSITMRVTDIQEGELAPLVTRFFPGHQEVIAGSEGVIVTKRLGAPYKTTDDRALFWLLECQAEGDRVLRLEIDIDWGEPLSQRIVDGLLVAQHNPGPARGLYQQSNAESTRIFGNPHGRPDQADLDNPARAHLTYHVLVNGIVEVPLILTVSDVGEQLAWSSFCRCARLKRFTTSAAATGRGDFKQAGCGRPTLSLILLSNAPVLRRFATFSAIAPARRLPIVASSTSRSWWRRGMRLIRCRAATCWRTCGGWPRRRRGNCPKRCLRCPNLVVAGRPESLLTTNGAYIQALAAHIHRHRTAPQFLREHLNSVRLCADALIRLRAEEPTLFSLHRAVSNTGDPSAHGGLPGRSRR
jgi:hypothetical protein